MRSTPCLGWGRAVPSGMSGLCSARLSPVGCSTLMSGQGYWMCDSFRAGVQIWWAEWGAGRSPWGVTCMDEAGGVSYATCAGFGPSGKGLDGLCQPNKRRWVGSDL